MTKHLAGACLFLVFIIKMDEEAPIDHDENSYLEEKIEIEDLVLTDDSKIKVEITAFPTVIKKEKIEKHQKIISKFFINFRTNQDIFRQ